MQIWSRDSMQFICDKCGYAGERRTLTLLKSGDEYNGKSKFIKGCPNCHKDAHWTDTNERPMRIEKNLMLATAKGTAQHIVTELNKLSNFKDKKAYFDKPENMAFDFAIADVCDDKMTLEKIHRQCTGWYGINSVDSGHNSSDIVLIGDYHGGGSAALFQIYDGMESGEMEAGIENLILTTMMREAGFSTLLLVEFAEECTLTEGDGKNVC